MGSARFQALDLTLKRIARMNLIECHMEAAAARSFKASLIVNPRTGKPLPLIAATAGARTQTSASA